MSNKVVTKKLECISVDFLALFLLYLKTKLDRHDLHDIYSWAKVTVVPGGVLLGILGGSDARFFKYWPYFGPKNVIFHTCFQTLPLKSIPVFRSGLYAEIMLSLLRLQRKQKSSSKRFRIRTFLFLSYSFGIETINTFIHSRSSLKNHTRFQTKMGKVYTRFQTKTAQKPYLTGRHISIWLIYWSTPPPPSWAWGEPNTCSLCFSSYKRQIPIRNTHARLDILEGLSLEFWMGVWYVTNQFCRFWLYTDVILYQCSPLDRTTCFL